MSYMVHEHSYYTSAIDKYWIFDDENCAIKFYKKKVKANIEIECIDYDYYEESFETTNKQEINKQILEELPECIYLTEGDFLVFSHLNKYDCFLYGRRP